MIVSASRRTDIPAFYSEWFLNRLKAGYVLVRQPRNITRLSHVDLNPAIVDCLVFWTKNPQPMLDKVVPIKQMGYKFYFQFTLTPYDETIEPYLPAKSAIIETLKKLSSVIGPEKVIWRYDPIIISDKFTVDYHLEKFAQMAENLHGYTDRCIFSFVDLYRKNMSKMQAIGWSDNRQEYAEKIGEGFSQIAKQHNLQLFTCSENLVLDKYGIKQPACIDKELIEKIIGYPITVKQELNQREHCNCVQSVDIGSYDTCAHGCIYCYANNNRQLVLANINKHDKMSPVLSGCQNDDCTISKKQYHSLRDKQIKLFD